MSKFNEMQVYQNVKRFMLNADWHILGGQPPSGTDHHPVIEIKDPDNDEKGSRGSLKPDMIAMFEDTLYVVELKPRWNASDRKKLLGFLADTRRIDAFYDELNARMVRTKESHFVSSLRDSLQIVGALGYAGQLESDEELATFHISDSGNVTFIPPVISGNV